MFGMKCTFIFRERVVDSSITSDIIVLLHKEELNHPQLNWIKLLWIIVSTKRRRWKQTVTSWTLWQDVGWLVTSFAPFCWDLTCFTSRWMQRVLWRWSMSQSETHAARCLVRRLNHTADSVSKLCSHSTLITQASISPFNYRISSVVFNST